MDRPRRPDGLARGALSLALAIATFLVVWLVYAVAYTAVLQLTGLG